MLDHDLDQLLQRSRSPEPSPDAVAVARDLARAVRAAPPGRRRSWHRRPRLLAVGLGGALLLSASTTLTAYQLSIPPFQSLPEGLQRLDHPIPLDFVEPDGTPRRCLVFLEFEGVDTVDLDRLDDVVGDRTWTPDEQRAVTGSAGRPAPTSEDELLLDTVGDHLYEFAASVVPGLTDERIEGRPMFSGYGATCRTDAS